MTYRWSLFNFLVDLQMKIAYDNFMDDNDETRKMPVMFSSSIGILNGNISIDYSNR